MIRSRLIDVCTLCPDQSDRCLYSVPSPVYLNSEITIIPVSQIHACCSDCGSGAKSLRLANKCEDLYDQEGYDPDMRPDSSVGKTVVLTTRYIPLPHGFELH